MMKVLISNVLAYVIPGKKELYLSVLENKKHNVLVKKGVDKVLSELPLYEASFKLKLEMNDLEDEVVAYVKNSNFPSSDEYYKVLNFDIPSAFKILLEADNEKGVFSGDFEVYLNETSKEVSFICQGMNGYQEALDEMTRRFYIEVGKKTKKWIPGHRYDCVDGTYYYLGTYLARKKEEFNSTFMTALEDMTPVHIYTTKLDGEKKISEVFQHQCYTDKELKVFWTDKLPSCVDSGAVLEDDSPSLYSLYTEMVENAISRPDITELKPVFDVLCYLSHLDPLCYPEEVKEPIRKIVHKLIEDIVLENWNKTRSREERCIGEAVDQEKNIERIRYSFLLSGSIQDGNILERYYYDELFKALSIDLNAEISEFLETWDEKKLYSSFSEFCKYNSYFENRSTPGSTTSIQRSGEKTTKISDLFGNGVLCETIKELINKANKNYGEGISSYRVIKTGKVVTSISCIVTLDDILKGGELSDELKDEILLNKFTRAIVYFDKDKEIE